MPLAQGKGVCSGLNTSEAPGGQQVKQMKTGVSLVLESFIFKPAQTVKMLFHPYPVMSLKNIYSPENKVNLQSQSMELKMLRVITE